MFSLRLRSTLFGLNVKNNNNKKNLVNNSNIRPDM